MSGIAGVIDLEGRRDGTSSIVKRMLDHIAHRGPAGETLEADPGIAIGVRHTESPEREEEQQPFVRSDRMMWAAIDGRIFNHTALRREMVTQGVRFFGDTDAELAAHLYAMFGVDCLDRIEGEFALVIWDAREKQFFAARDRLGVRHLCYTRQNGKVYFASEIKAIVGSGEVDRRLDLKALDQVLYMNCPVAPRTMFEGVSALPAGHFLLVKPDRVIQEPYWDLDFAPEPLGPTSEAQYREQLLVLLEDAVAARTPSDRPVGVYLSGGLDSSAVTALMAGNGLGEFPAYIADFDAPAYSERDFALLTANAVGAPLHVTEISFHRIGRHFPQLIWHGEAPLVLAESVSLLILAQRAAQDVDVVLNGEGGDEILAGYVFNDWDRIYRTLRRFPLTLTLPLIRAALPVLGYPKAFVMSAEEQRPALEHFGCFPAPLYYNYAVREVIDYYSPETRARLEDYVPEADIAQVLDTDRMAAWDPLSQSLYFSTKINLPNYLLGPHGDRATGSAGLESFFPLLDRRLMEFAARLPNELKVRGGQEKYLLKRAAEGLVPPEVIDRKKSPMTSPTSPAFLGPDAPAYVEHLLSKEMIEKKGYFDSQRVSQMVENLRQRDPSQDRNNRLDVMLSFPLVGVLSTQIFDELFIENFTEEPPDWD
jgi:asparagine synthase (glutamine-hydrolysing)